ncbi:2-nitropropane dioxygenase [Streptomyces cinnamoneus]|uniref:Probable nitronate monooxygenase n=1 Tax=Streptomyces cinnamoneus TaxID=53446 RepID=A0A2G1XFT2_STRCJ|nr:nitronate monooxygenase [Streptomyces cinnamoneus]PHQ50098.1 2-nitropropane dioxygenase [Streptomyces cinnamoneus]PPT13122.1 2-nitropropane dioxygenase [Streptomyces cinnamoneus]
MAPLTGLFEHPIVQAPMAGASSPVLAAAVSDAGGLGFLAAGYRTPAAMREQITRLRALTARPFGVNLFMPQPPVTDPAAVDAYAGRLADESARYATPLGDWDQSTDDAYDAKLAVLLDDPVPVVSFHFGCPDRDVLHALAAAGTVTMVTATSATEALAAQEAGAAAVCVQGVEAGGHQGTHRDDPRADGTGRGLLELLAEVRASVTIPLVAAGGLMRGDHIATALAAGACAAQLGTAFLPCPESDANPLHKRALTDPAFARTELTRAFTGRPARGLVNRFIREHGPAAPAAYPQLHHLTSGLRKAAAAAGDPQAMALWAGEGHRLARALPAGELVAVLAAELDRARKSSS